MTLQMLRCFCAVAQTQSFGQAAGQLCITQPAVTHQIQSLEEELGVRLIERTRHHVSLTPAGISFYSDAEDILKRLDMAADHVSSPSMFNETVTVGFQSTVQILLLPDIYRAFKKACPDIYVNNMELNISDGRISLPDQVDAAFLTKDCAGGRKDFRYFSLLRGRFCCILPVEHRLARYPEVSEKDLPGETLILLDTSHCPPQIGEIQTEIKRSVPGIRYFLSTSALYTVPMVEAGLGIAVMPDFICPQSANVVKVPYRTDLIPEFGIVSHAGSDRTGVRKFTDTVRKIYRR